MKKIKSYILLLISVFLLTSCNSNTSMNENFKPTEVEGISMKIKDLTDKGATVIINDINKKGTYIYGESFRIDKKENGSWSELEETGNNCAFNSIAYYVNDDGVLEMNQNWNCMYGSLEVGEYRLVKDIILESDKPTTDDDKKYISVEFRIE